MPAYTRKRIAILHSQQPANQYAGAGTGVADSEQAWMRKLGLEVTAELIAAGHDAILSPLGHSYADNVRWANGQSGVDFLVSLHSNATGKSEAQAKGTVGIGIYHHPSSRRGKELALSLLPFLRPVSAAGKAYVTTITVAEVASTNPPALLVENEYHDWQGSPTTGGAEWIRDAGNRTRLAKAYRAWVISMFGEKSPLPPVVVVPPVVIPVPVGEIRLRVAEVNCLSTRFSRTFTRRRSNLVKVMKSAAADVYLVNECAEPMRDYICSHMPGGAGRWKVRRRGEQAIIFDGMKYYSPDDKWFPVNFTDYHGGVIATLIDKATKRAIAFGSYHLPPNSLVSLAKQLGYFRKFLAAVPHGPAIIGGDGVNGEDWGGVPWRSVRRSATNSDSRDMPTYKTSVTDHLWSGPQIQWRGYSVKPTKGSSDHNLIVGACAIPAPIVVPSN